MYIMSTLQVEKLRAELVPSLSLQAVAERGGVAYLERLVPSKEEFDEAVEGAQRDGGGLVEIFSRPPLDPLSPADRIEGQLGRVEEAKKEVNILWERAWHPGAAGVRSEPIGQSPSHSSQGEATPPVTEEDHVTSSESGSSLEAPAPVRMCTVQGGGAEVRKVGQVGVVSKRSSDQFSELEEEVYEVSGRGRGQWVWPEVTMHNVH